MASKMIALHGMYMIALLSHGIYMIAQLCHGIYMIALLPSKVQRVSADRTDHAGFAGRLCNF